MERESKQIKRQADRQTDKGRDNDSLAVFINLENQDYQNITPSAQDTVDGLAGSSRLSLLITLAIEQEVGPLVLPDD